MGDNTLNTITTPKVIEADDINQYGTALTGNFLPREPSSGAVETKKHDLGSAAYEWNNVYMQNLIIDGTLFDPASAGTSVDAANAIVSGATRADSGQPDFIRASGSGANMTILASTTPLQITANSISVTISSDIAVSSLTTAPTSNNTCLINDSSLTGGAETKYTGEHENDPLYIDTAGTEITDRIGQYICLKGASEYMFAFVESATTLRHIYRGFFFDSSGDPIVREVLNDNDTLTLMSLGWVFIDANGTTVDVTYKSPIYSGVEPSSPDTDDYWFDLVNRVWKRYDGSNFVIIDRMLIGCIVIDDTNAVASRSFDFTKAFSPTIEMEVEIESVDKCRSKAGRNIISVYAKTSEYMAAPAVWDITTDLESGLTEANSTVYYLYLTETGQSKISTERPYNRLSDLQGFYHPYHSWRYVGVAYNNSSGDIDNVNSLNSDVSKEEVFTSSGSWLSLPNKSVKLLALGGGGGGRGTSGNGGTGGNSSVGSLIYGYGGSGGSLTDGGSGGTGAGGDIYINGGDGDVNIVVSSTLYSSGAGGGSYFASKRTNNPTSIGLDGLNYGGGGNPHGNTTIDGGEAGGGGGGGCSIGCFYALSGIFSVSVGAGGSGGSSNGGGGAKGVVIIEYL